MRKLVKHKINWLYIIVALAFLVTGSVFIYQQWFLKKGEGNQIPRGSCLIDDEIATYEMGKEGVVRGMVKIFIKDQKSGVEKFNFKIDNVSETYHSIEIHTCGVYVLKMLNYDPEKTKQDPGFKAEIWKYQYNGEGDNVILLAEKDQSGVFKANFSYDFRIDPLEKHLVLRRSYLGHPEYALVIKNLKTQENVFVLTLDETLEKHSNIQAGSFGLGVWTTNSKYLWGVLYVGAYDTAYYRIEAGTWKTDILSPPLDLPSGAERDFNFKGYLAYADMTSFTGFEGATEQIEEEARKTGGMKNLWFYNLFTKEKKKIAPADPSWRFKPKWISDNELKYFDPEEGEKIYRVE